MSNTALLLIFAAGICLGFAVAWLWRELSWAEPLPAVPMGTLPDELIRPNSYVVNCLGRPMRFTQGVGVMGLMVEATKFATEAKALAAAKSIGLNADDYVIQPTIFAPNDHQI